MPIQVTLLDGQYTSIATPTDPTSVVEPNLTQSFTLSSDTVIPFTFTVKPPTPPPVAQIGATPTTGQVPLTVQFSDQSTGTVSSRAWDFGDGTGTSTDASPSYTYQNAGTYTVKLTVANSAGVNSASVVISATPPPSPPTPWQRFVAWFIAWINGIFHKTP